MYVVGWLTVGVRHDIESGGAAVPQAETLSLFRLLLLRLTSYKHSLKHTYIVHIGNLPLVV